MRRSKRVLDVTVAVAGLSILAPMLIVIALVVKATDGGPILFRQSRVGRGGRLFRMLKFRTMVVGAEQRDGGPLTVGADPRITGVGRWLRRVKLDELPQLWNVVRGEMSLVGPRPEVPMFVQLYSPEQRRVLDLVPGITDPASIRFCNESELLAVSADPHQAYVSIILPAKIRLNRDYAARANWPSDVLEIAKTLWRIARPRASNASDWPSDMSGGMDVTQQEP